MDEQQANHRMAVLLRENGDLHARIRELEAALDPESVQHWDRTCRERDQAIRCADKLYEALLWCSGSSDFAPGGMAAKGWEAGPRRALEAYRSMVDALDPRYHTRQTGEAYLKEALAVMLPGEDRSWLRMQLFLTLRKQIVEAENTKTPEAKAELGPYFREPKR